MIRKTAITLLLLLITLDALADGRMYWKETVPPKIPYQRALLLFKDEIETIILQSRYAIPQNEPMSSLGWVVPVPAAPEVGSMSADEATTMFRWLDRNTSPHVTEISQIMLSVLVLLPLTILLISLASFVIPLPPKIKSYRGKLIRFSLLSLLASVVAIFFLLPAKTRGLHGIELVAEHHAGVYDVRVVKSKDAGDLISWLNANEFKFSREDKTAFESYISKGWCFVVAKVNLARVNNESLMASEGLAAPLILRFQHQQPIYPVVLTGTGNHDTEILIYLATETKMTGDERIRLRFAGEMNRLGKEGLNRLSSAVKPAGLFKPTDLSFPYLCKFKDTLTSADMQNDIVFTRAHDDENYREHVMRW